MRPCQLCGVNSWGPPLSASEVIERLKRFCDGSSLIAVSTLSYYRCDHCKSLALVTAVDEPTVKPQAAVSDDLFAVGMADMVSALRESAPVRPNRTERLVHTLLQSDLLDTHEVDTAESIVGFARELELALDKSAPCE